MTVTPGNAQHVGSRQSQQDSFGFSDLSRADFREHGGVLALICDGMGGLEAGDQASRAAVTAMIAAYQRKTPGEAIEAALLRAADEANRAVYSLGVAAGAPGDVGTTLIAAVVHQEKLYWLTAGDSPLLLVRDGKLSVLNHEHTYAQRLSEHVAEGKIRPEDAARHPERGSLTSYLGMETLGETDRGSAPLRPGDRLLLASDGLTKSLSPGEIVAEAGHGSQEICETLVSKAIAQGHRDQDNVTVVSLAIEAETPAASPPAPLSAPPPARRRWIWAAAAAAVLAASWFVWQSRLCCSPPPERLESPAGPEAAAPPPAPGAAPEVVLDEEAAKPPPLEAQTEDSGPAKAGPRVRR